MPNPVITRAIDRVAGGTDLTADEASQVLREVMEDRASEAQSAAFMIALRTKGETVAEIAGLARTMRELALRVETGQDGLVDTAGTGGGAPTFNVSTTAALIAAAAGCKLAKHGNRSATSQCGSADVLEALGVRIDLGPEAVAACIEELNFGFMFAPRFHLAMRYVVPVRKELAVRTIFNFLGPLTNPAGARRQVIGVSDPKYMQTIAAALAELGTERALVVSSADGLDELSAAGPTRVVELKGGTIESYEFTPGQAGLEAAAHGAVGAGSPAQNAQVVHRIFAGAEGVERSTAALNAGAALYVGGHASSIADGVRSAETALDGGAASRLLERLVERTRELAEAH